MAIGIAGCVLAVALGFGSNAGLPTWLRYVIPAAITMGIWFLLTAAVMFWGSKFGKLRLRDKVIASIPCAAMNKCSMSAAVTD